MENANEINTGAVFQERFKKLVGNSTQEEVAKKIDTSRQNVGNWLGGKSRPDIYALAEISKAFSVSTDYLLGRTDIKSLDENVQKTGKYIGCDERTVEQLREIYIGQTNEFSEEYRSEYVRFLNMFFTDDILLYLILNIFSISYTSNEYLKRFFRFRGKVDFTNLVTISRLFNVELSTLSNAFIMPTKCENDNLALSTYVSEQIDLSRYKTTKLLEDLLNLYDKREEIKNYTTKEQWLKLFGMTEEEFYNFLELNKK